MGACPVNSEFLAFFRNIKLRNSWIIFEENRMTKKGKNKTNIV